MKKPRYISSVSGGTWASSIYTFLPNEISDQQLLGQYVPPAKLSIKDGKGLFNITAFSSQYSLGHAPKTMGFVELSVSALFFLHKYPKKQHKWMWASIVAEHILGPFNLRAKGDKPWSSTQSFTLSQSYAEQHFPTQAPDINKLFMVKQHRPFLIMNDNMITGSTPSNSVYFPQQVTAIAGGSYGQAPNDTKVGGGTVESYAYTSQLAQLDISNETVTVKINQPYSLIDIVSTSSAFFAGALIKWIHEQLNNDDQRKQLIEQARAHAQTKQDSGFFSHLSDDIGSFIDNIECDIENWVSGALNDLSCVAPEFNYWPVQSPSHNTIKQFTDGGTLENTGILGMLAQTDTGKADEKPIYLVAFDNTQTPLTKKGDKIIAAGQVAPLFGIDFDETNGHYTKYTQQQQNPDKTEFIAKSLIQVFENDGSDAPFDQLVQGLYQTNCGTTGKINSSPAFCQLSLTTIENSLAKITAGRKVELLYIQNAKTLDWQNALGDAELKQQIADGQNSNDPIKAFKDFPNYNTFFKIGLTAEESNALSQMWAWCIADQNSPLSATIKTFFAKAN